MSEIMESESHSQEASEWMTTLHKPIIKNSLEAI